MSAPEFPKRTYKEAGLFEDAAGFGVALDGHPVRTPSGGEFRTRARPLAKACAAEWAGQGERIVIASMPLTLLVYAVIDQTPQRRNDLIAHVAKYAETDLICHRASHPASLAIRQSTAWDPIHAWAVSELGIALPLVFDVVAPALVDPVLIDKVRAAAGVLDDFKLTALAQATPLAGSALIGFALTHRQIDAAQAFRAATVDESWNMESWGEDSEAKARFDAIQRDLDILGRFLAALG